MPYVSKSQAAWAHTSAGEKALGGPAKVAEWDAATKGKHLPKRAGKSLGMADIGRGGKPKLGKRGR